MSTVLTMISLRVRTAEGWQDPYNLNAPMVAIVGPVDTGKSSLLDCIAFALGRDVVFRGAVNYHVIEVELVARIGGQKFTLRRQRSPLDQVLVLDQGGTPEGTFPITTSDGRVTLSEWLLEQLDLADVFASVRLDDRRRLDFANSLLPYCYLTQADIDRHIIRSARDNKARLRVLRLLFNLTTPEHERRLGEIEEHDLALRKLAAKEKVISEFLDEEETTDRDAVRSELVRLRTEEAEALGRLARCQQSLRDASSVDDEQRERLDRLAAAHSAAEAELDRTRKTRDARHRDLEDIENALKELTQLENEPSTLDLGVVSDCPACGSPPSPAPPGTCYLCHKPIPGMEHAELRRQLTTQHQQAADHVREADKAFNEAKSAAAKAWKARADLRGLLDQGSQEAVSPYVSSVSSAAAEVARIQGTIETLTRLNAAHDRVDRRRAEIDRLASEQDERRDRAKLDPTEVRNLEDVVNELNIAFRSIVRQIDMPHSTGRARIDSGTLLPIVDDQKFESRGGGARSAVSIAYSLALLRHTIEQSMATLPGFLAIDSPQKNFGANDNDKALAHRVYERFLDYLDDVAQRRIAERGTYQVIIVDNDLDESVAKRCLVHQFGRSDGFIKGLTDPNLRPGEQGTLFDDELVLQPDFVIGAGEGRRTGAQPPVDHGRLCGLPKIV